MDDTLQHDPRTKQQIKDLIYNTLYKPIEEALQRRIDTLIIKNTMLLGATHKSFVYKGVVYSSEATKSRRMNRLVPDLAPEMEDYLAEVKQLNDQELPYVLGFINQVLNSSSALQDYLRVLPDALHEPLKRLAATCPCGSHHLTEEQVQLLQDKNTATIDLIKQRMVKNLLI